MQDQGPCSQPRAAYITRQLCQGLSHLHSQSIIHRDIKPENLLLIFQVLKISDFGWGVYSPVYKRRTFCGTLDYVPPEIVKGEFYDERVDVWSLGILLFELLFQDVPFGGDGEEDTFDNIVGQGLTIPKGCSQEVRAVLVRVLEKEQKKRVGLKDIENSKWLRKYQREGRAVKKDIWEFWQSIAK